MQYQIMRHVKGREFVPYLDDTTQEMVVVPSAKEAAVLAAQLTGKHGVKFQPRPLKIIKLGNTWQDREQKRFEDGGYKPVLWFNEPWWKDIDGHFAHISVKNPTHIAFTPDAEKGEADKQVTILPGKYLQKFFGQVLTSKQIRTFAMQHSLQFEDKELKFAVTVEEIERVYVPKLGCSCFSGTTKANLYGSGDFAVAYLEQESKITARSVCVPTRKIYVHPYGDRDRIETLLGKAGYEEVEYGNEKFRGLRLLKKWHWPGFYADWGTPKLKVDPKDNNFFVIE